MARPFFDRRDAGEKLAQRLLMYRDDNPVVLGLLRGGIVVAAPVARALDCPLEPLIARKVGAPGHAEFGIGAVAPGVSYANPETLTMVGLTHEQFVQLARKEMEEVERRRRVYLADREPIDLRDRVAILVDDGLATGVTAIAAARYIRGQRPNLSVLAIPVCSTQGANMLGGEVDEVVCLEMPETFYAVGQWYERFDQTTDQEVLEILGYAS